VWWTWGLQMLHQESLKCHFHEGNWNIKKIRCHWKRVLRQQLEVWEVSLRWLSACNDTNPTAEEYPLLEPLPSNSVKTVTSLYVIESDQKGAISDVSSKCPTNLIINPTTIHSLSIPCDNIFPYTIFQYFNHSTRTLLCWAWQSIKWIIQFL
jgi:hypothetical protein